MDPEPRLQPIRLVVLEGPDRGLEASVCGRSALVGTEDGCDLVLTDPDVSSRHVALELRGDSAHVRDLGSTSGTRYLGAPVEQGDVPIGSAIELGRSKVGIFFAMPAEELLSPRGELQGLIGRSVPMRRLFGQVERVAPTDFPILLLGETGVGKEAVAHAIHALSPRRDGPFRVFDCTATPPGLLATALFGAAKGAFTGALADVPGALEQAHGGTLFVDEIGEIPAEVQSVFLRALETKTFSRVGETTKRQVDFRLVSATHRALDSLDAGVFHRGLYFRVSGIVLTLPPLRERPEDILLLAEHFARSAGAENALSPDMLGALLGHTWPGNVRELKNVVHRFITLGSDLGVGTNTGERPATFYELRDMAVRAFEKSYLHALLKKHNGNAATAAKEAAVARSYFYRLLEKHGLVPKDPRTT